MRMTPGEQAHENQDTCSIEKDRGRNNAKMEVVFVLVFKAQQFPAGMTYVV